MARMIMSIATVLSCLGFATIGHAQVENGSFESGDFDGWQLAGDGQVITSSPARTDGGFGAIITTSGNISDSEIEDILALPPGEVDLLADSNAFEGATAGSVLQQTFFAAAGDVLEFDWRFACDDIFPFNDFAAVVIDGEAQVLSRVDSCEGRGILGFATATEFASFRHVFSSDGNHYVGFFTVNVIDDAFDAGLIVDNVRIVAGQPEIIMDNHDHGDPGPDITLRGTWRKASSARDHFGRTGLFAVTGGEIDRYRFTPRFTGPGNYRVMVWNNCFSPRANNTPHTIAHADGITTVAVDQDCATGVTGEWLTVGTFAFDAGTDGYLEVSDAGLAPGQFISVDGVRFVREGVLIVDNGQPGTSRIGDWRPATGASEHYGADSVYAQVAPDDYAAYRFTPEVPAAGRYLVFAWNACFSPRANNVPYIVQHNAGFDTVVVDQDCATGSHGQWNLLGSFDFNSGTSGYVEITSPIASDYVYIGADAVLFAPLP